MPIRTQVSCLVLFLAVLLAKGPSRAEVDPVAEPGRFYTAVSQTFHVPEAQIRGLADRGLAPGQIVVVCFMAGGSLRQANQVLADRRAGKSWRDIAMAGGLEPESFYDPRAESGAPFVNVYALYREVPRDDWAWKRLPLQDNDIETLVQLHFLAELVGPRWPDLGKEIVPLRAEGRDLVSIHHFLLNGQQTAQLATEGPAVGASFLS